MASQASLLLLGDIVSDGAQGQSTNNQNRNGDPKHELPPDGARRRLLEQLVYVLR
jgi:hypothetical protein